MDPKQNQPQNQPNQQQVNPTPVRQPVTPPPPQPVSGGKREAPIPQAQQQEWVSASTPEVVLPKEVKDAGVEVQAPVLQVSQSAQQAGVQHAKETTPVQSVKAEPLGMKTSRGVLHHLKAAHKSVKESLSWLVRLIIKEQDKKERGVID